MENNYLDKLMKLLNQTHPRLIPTYKLEFRNVFGAVAGYINNNIFITYGDFGVGLKLPPKTLKNTFKERGVKHLKYFPNVHIKKEYAVIPKNIIENKKQFKKLLDKSIKYINAI